MSTILTISILFIAATIITGVYCIVKGVHGKRVKNLLGINIFAFFGFMIVTTIFMLSGSVSYAEEAQVIAATGISNGEGIKYLAAAISTGLASIGAGIAVAVTGSAAIGAISENESLLGKTIIFVGLAEGIAIYGLIISIMILG